MGLLFEELFQRTDRRAPEDFASANVLPVEDTPLAADDRIRIQPGMLSDADLAADDRNVGPTVELPDIPVCAAITVCSPISTLCAI